MKNLKLPALLPLALSLAPLLASTLAASAFADDEASIRTVCVIHGAKPGVMKLKMQKGTELSLHGKVIAKLETRLSALSAPGKRLNGSLGLFGWSLRSEDAFEYQGEMSGFTLTFLDEFPGIGFLKLDSEMLLAEFKALGAPIKGSHAVLVCRSTEATAPAGGTLTMIAPHETPALRAFRLQMSQEAFEHLGELLGGEAADGDASISFQSSTSVGYSRVGLSQLTLTGVPADLGYHGTLMHAKELQSFLYVEGKLASLIYARLEKSGKARLSENGSERSWSADWQSEDTPNAKYEMNCRQVKEKPAPTCHLSFTIQR